MATDPFDLFVIVAPVAAAFAGFGSLASGLGERRGGDHARVDAMRLGSMLSASLSATLLALLPVTLAGLLLDDQLATRTSALIAVIAIISLATISAARARRIRGLPGFSIGGAVANTICTLIALAAFVLCAAAVPYDRVKAMYLLGLLGLVGSSVVMFSRVISSMLRPHNEGRDVN